MNALLPPESAPPVRTAPTASRGAPAAAGDVAFDNWLRRELSRLYETTLSEPVPDELLRLLAEDAGRKKG